MLEDSEAEDYTPGGRPGGQNWWLSLDHVQCQLRGFARGCAEGLCGCEGKEWCEIGIV